MSRPAQLDMLEALTQAMTKEVAATETLAVEFFEFSGEGCEPGSLDDVPAILRFPGEPGYVELDKHYRPVAK